MNEINLKVGDTFRFNGARKFYKIINEFKFKNEGIEYFVCAEKFEKEYPRFVVFKKKDLCSIHSYGNIYDDIVELNNKIIRDKGGKLLESPKEAIKNQRKKQL